MNAKITTLISCLIATSLLADTGTTIRDVPLNATVDLVTIAIPHAGITNAVKVAEALHNMDTESLARAIQVGQDLRLINAGTNGWVIAVSNMVDVCDLEVPGTLFLGGVVYGRPRGGLDGVTLTGSNWYIERALPDSDVIQRGMISDDVWCEWYFGKMTNSMWTAINTLENLPADTPAVLQRYISMSNAAERVSAVRDEVNATNAVIEATIQSAIASIPSGGGGSAWTYSTTSSTYVTLQDHVMTVINYPDSSSFYISLPYPSGGVMPHCRLFINNYESWNRGTPNFSFDVSLYTSGGCKLWDSNNGYYNYGTFSPFSDFLNNGYSTLYLDFVCLDESGSYWFVTGGSNYASTYPDYY